MKSLLIVLCFGLSLSAFGFRGGFGNRGANMRGNMFKDLNLTEVQMEQLANFKREQMGKGQELRSSIQNLRKELKVKMSEDKLDEKRINELIDELSKLQKSKMLKQLESAKKLRKILTKEQIKKMNFKMLWQGKQGRRGFRGKNPRMNRGGQRGYQQSFGGDEGSFDYN